MAKDDLELKDLRQYYGTEKYYKLPICKSVYTDGIKYIMENGYSWFVTDSLIVAESKYKDAEFIVIKLKVRESGAYVTLEDGNGKMLYYQEYDYTDAKRDLVLYWTDGVLMLQGEY